MNWIGKHLTSLPTGIDRSLSVKKTSGNVTKIGIDNQIQDIIVISTWAHACGSCDLMCSVRHQSPEAHKRCVFPFSRRNGALNANVNVNVSLAQPEPAC